LIRIYYTSFTEQLPLKAFNDYLSLLPIDQIVRNNRFVRWQDKYLHLFGKLLLIEGIKCFDLGHEELSNVEYNKNNRPFFKHGKIDFNISHSGNYAICAVCDNSKIGVDIQEIKPLNFDEFNEVFTPAEWSNIESSPNPLAQFYSLWARKESIIKADGRGLSLPLNHIEVIHDVTEYDNEVWHLQNFFIHDAYSACLASSIGNINMRMFEVDFF